VGDDVPDHHDVIPRVDELLDVDPEVTELLDQLFSDEAVPELLMPAIDGSIGDCVIWCHSISGSRASRTASRSRRLKAAYAPLMTSMFSWDIVFARDAAYQRAVTTFFRV